MQANSADQTPHFVSSDLGLHYLPRSHKWTLGIYWLKCNYFAYPIRVAEIWEVYSFKILGLWVLGLAVSHINESNRKLMSPEHYFNDKSAILLHPGTR